MILHLNVYLTVYLWEMWEQGEGGMGKLGNVTFPEDDSFPLHVSVLIGRVWLLCLHLQKK